MREFPQSSFVMHPLGWVIPIAILVWIVLAVLLLRTNRKARGGDCFVWIVAGLALTQMFYIRGANELAVRGFRVAALYGLWSIVFLMCIISWIKVVRNNEGRPSPVAVSAIVASIVLALFFLLPAVQQARETGQGTAYSQCNSHLHLISLGLDYYHEEHAAWPLSQAGEPSHSWRVALLPHVDAPYVYAEYDFNEAWNSKTNAPLANEFVRVYWCPSMGWPERDEPRTTAYALLVGDDAAWTSSSVIDPEDIPDGAGHTAIVAEACGLGIIWTEPRDIDLTTTRVGINLPGDAHGHSPGILSTYHHEGANVLMADGSVRTFVIETEPSVLEAILTADGGDDVGF